MTEDSRIIISSITLILQIINLLLFGVILLKFKSKKKITPAYQPEEKQTDMLQQQLHEFRHTRFSRPMNFSESTTKITYPADLPGDSLLRKHKKNVP